ncbi:hypothetical protein H4Q26_014688, partial [Puccinia striiformis f. sp. tritici PST-130]
KSQNIIKDSPPSSELSDVSLATIKIAEKAKTEKTRVNKPKEGAKVTANAWTPIATAASSKKKKDKSLKAQGD